MWRRILLPGFSATYPRGFKSSIFHATHTGTPPLVPESKVIWIKDAITQEPAEFAHSIRINSFFLKNRQAQNAKKISDTDVLKRFTINDIAIAIGINPELIHSVELYLELYIIQFKPNFIPACITKTLGPTLKANDVNFTHAIYDGTCCELHIQEESLNKFMHFVTNANKPGFYPGV